MIKFGPSGASEDFLQQGFKKTSDGIPWLKNQGVDLFEYSFGKGVHISQETATIYGKAFQDGEIEISVHAPYFINLATLEEDKAQNNLRYINDSLIALKNFKGKRCVFHPGSPLKQDRKAAMKVLLNSFEKVCQLKHENGFDDLILCPETMGKKAQLGDLDEVISMCKIGDKSIIPCIDFGHLNSRECGIIKSKDDYKRIIDKLVDELGVEKAFNIHVHFSKIQYTDKGELRHLTFEDTTFGPEFEPLIELFYEYKMSPYVVCESAGTQTQDSLLMKKYFYSLSQK